jgi:hypothetical protein
MSGGCTGHAQANGGKRHDRIMSYTVREPIPMRHRYAKKQERQGLRFSVVTVQAKKTGPFNFADRIREAIEASHAGLAKNQIRRLFHCHVEGNRIDAALKKLVVRGALTTHSEPTGGRPSILWSAIEEEEHEDNGESVAEDEEPADDE